MFDIETNGLDEKLTKVHCIVIYDIESQEYHKYAPDDVPDGIAKLSEYDKLIGHNIISFDIPALDKVFNWTPRPEVQIQDTLIMSRLMYPDMKERDFAERRIMPNLYGRHSLESWGERLAFQKGKFGEGEQIFNNFSVDMLNYCARDVELNYKLYDLLCKRNFSSSSIELEHDIYRICEKQKENGFPFDSLKAARFYAILCEHRVLLHKQLKKKFGTWTVPDGPPFTPRVNNKRLGYVKGKEVQKLRTVEFNPNSRQHIAKRLKDIHGWEPKEFTPSGEAKIDESILESLPYPEAKMMAEAFRTNKMIGQLSEGQNGWLHMEKQGKLHGTVHTMGTIASRCSHSHLTWVKYRISTHPLGKNVDNSSTLQMVINLWDVMSQVLKLGLLLITLLGMTTGYLVILFSRETYTLTIKKPWAYLVENLRKHFYMLYFMVQVYSDSVRLWVRDQRKVLNSGIDSLESYLRSRDSKRT